MTLLLAALLTIGAVAFTLLVRSKDIHEEPSSPTRHLEERKARIYEGLRDLQFEFRVGKLSEGDYEKSKAELQKELERVTGQIEVAASGKSVAPPAAEAASKPASATVCPHCHTAFEKPMKFCGECGRPMAGGAA